MVLFLGWKRPVAGREKAAMELFGEGMGLWADLQKAGQIASFEPVLLAAHGGDLNGFILLRGDQAKLDAVRTSDRFMDLTTRAVILLEGFGVVPGWEGEGLMKQMQRYQKFIP
jgi:hypothetical protein